MIVRRQIVRRRFVSWNTPESDPKGPSGRVAHSSLCLLWCLACLFIAFTAYVQIVVMIKGLSQFTTLLLGYSKGFTKLSIPLMRDLFRPKNTFLWHKLTYTILPDPSTGGLTHDAKEWLAFNYFSIPLCVGEKAG